MKIKTVLVSFITVIIFIFGILFYSYNDNLKSISDNTKEITFIIKDGMTAGDVLTSLEDRNIIKSALVAKVYLKFNESNFKSGAFKVNESMDVATIIEYLSNSDNILKNEVDVTLIEGYWLKHMADEISSKTNLSSEELLLFWNDQQQIRQLMSEYEFLKEDIFKEDIRYNLEGYLFPDTYRFDIETTPIKVTKKLLDKTNEIYQKYQKQIEDSSLTIHELFTLSSIVQYESKSVEDMHNIAQVFYNRMNKGMKLQSSVTVCYAKNISDDWKSCETTPDFESPYNTYVIDGLPVGPVTSFSENALNATLNPNKNDYLFFVADVYGDGSVYYAKTYQEHLNNVKKFNLEF